ncbi:MAG: hypothetical protein D6781_12655 [Verrucomicrobia bacterium]|nr:MAG: hypothetical protein D6781_12655 [Verrucomicrobiota bacterium]
MRTTALLGCVAAVVAAFSSAPAHATGMIGQRHLSATWQYTWVESAAFENGSGYSVFANMPFEGATPFDLSVGYNRFEKDGARPQQPDITTNEWQGYLTLIGLESHNSIPFLRLGLGWADWSASDGNEADDGIYSISVGAEMFQNTEFTFTPFLTWTDSFGGDIDGRLTYGATVEWSPSEYAGILVRLEGDDHYNFSAGIGAVVRF